MFSGRCEQRYRTAIDNLLRSTAIQHCPGIVALSFYHSPLVLLSFATIQLRNESDDRPKISPIYED